MRDINLVKDNVRKMIDQDAPEADIDEYLSLEGYTPDQLRQGKAQQPMQPKQEGSALGNFARGLPVGLGRAATGFVQAATDLGENAARRAEKAIYGDTMDQQTFGNRLAGQVQQQNEQLAQEPLSTRFGVGVGEVLPYLSTGAGTGKAVSSVIGGAAGRIAGLGAAGAVGGATQQALSAQEEAGLQNRLEKTGEGAAMGAAFGAGLGALAEGGKAVAKGTKEFGKQIYKGYKATPIDDLPMVADEIAQGSSALYKQVEESGAYFKPDATRVLLNEIDSAVKEGGSLFKTNHPKTLGILKDIKQDIALKQKAGQSISLPQLDQYRKALSTASNEAVTPLGKSTDDGRRLGNAVAAIDDFLSQNPPEKILVSGDSNAINLYKNAQKEWQRYSQFSEIANIVKKADGDANRMKTLTKNFLDNPKKTRGYSPEIINGLKKASQNSNPEALSKALGKFGFDLGSGRNIGNTIVPGASILYGGPKGSSAAAVGTLARQAQKMAARGKVEDVLNIIRGAKPQEAEKIINSLPLKTRNIILTNLTTKTVEE